MADTPATAPTPTGQTAKTAAAAGSGTALTIILLSIGLHLNIHLTEEEAVAWTGAITAAAGWIGHRLERRLDAKQQAELAALETDAARLAANPAVQAIVSDAVSRALAGAAVAPKPSTATSATVSSGPAQVQSGATVTPSKPVPMPGTVSVTSGTTPMSSHATS